MKCSWGSSACRVQCSTEHLVNSVETDSGHNLKVTTSLNSLIVNVLNVTPSKELPGLSDRVLIRYRSIAIRLITQVSVKYDDLLT